MNLVDFLEIHWKKILEFCFIFTILIFLFHLESVSYYIATNSNFKTRNLAYDDVPAYTTDFRMKNDPHSSANSKLQKKVQEYDDLNQLTSAKSEITQEKVEEENYANDDQGDNVTEKPKGPKIYNKKDSTLTPDATNYQEKTTTENIATDTPLSVQNEGKVSLEGFQRIDKTNIWIFSVHYSESVYENDPALRAVGITDVGEPDSLVCHVQFENGSKTDVIGEVANFKDKHQRYPYSCGITCSLNGSTGNIARFVSFTFNNDSDAEYTNQFPVIYQKRQPPPYDFTICYSILHSNFNHPAQLVQSIEFNLLMGARHFFIYTYSVSRDVQTVLDFYTTRGVLTQLKWDPPHKLASIMWYYGQNAALNDCLYRNRHLAEFLAVVDTDELIVPYKSSSWKEMFLDIDAEELLILEDSKEFRLKEPEDRKQYSLPARSFKDRATLLSDIRPDVLVFLTSYFDSNPNPDSNEIFQNCSDISEKEFEFALKYHFTSLINFWRRSKVFPLGYRSKSFMRPEKVLLSGVHFPYKLVPGIKMVEVSPDIGIGHHHKADIEVATNLTWDSSIMRFKDKLYSRLEAAVKQLPSVFS